MSGAIKKKLKPLRPQRVKDVTPFLEAIDCKYGKHAKVFPANRVLMTCSDLDWTPFITPGKMSK